MRELTDRVYSEGAVYMGMLTVRGSCIYGYVDGHRPCVQDGQ